MESAVHQVFPKGVNPVSDPSTYWLTIMNIGLGVVVLICCAAVGIGVMQELAAKRKKRTELAKLDREVADLVASYGDGHAFNVPNLGVTMADGGEDLRKKEDR
jgi:hypothetical protein